MRKLLFLFVMLLAVCDSQAEGVFKVNGEIIEKTPALITMDYSQTGYLQVKFSDGSVVSYNMNLVEFYPDYNIATSIQNTTKEEAETKVSSIL